MRPPSYVENVSGKAAARLSISAETLLHVRKGITRKGGCQQGKKLPFPILFFIRLTLLPESRFARHHSNLSFRLRGASKNIRRQFGQFGTLAFLQLDVRGDRFRTKLAD